MVGVELKGLIVMLLLASIIMTAAKYKEVWVDTKSYLFGLIEIENGFMPQRSWWIWLMVSFGLFIYGLYLNEQPPIILF